MRLLKFENEDTCFKCVDALPSGSFIMMDDCETLLMLDDHVIGFNATLKDYDFKITSINSEVG